MNEFSLLNTHWTRREISGKINEMKEGNISIELIYSLLQSFYETSSPKESLFPSLTDCITYPLINFLLQNLQFIQNNSFIEESESCAIVIKYLALLADSPFFNRDQDLSNNQTIRCLLMYFTSMEELQKEITKIFIQILKSSQTCPKKLLEDDTIRDFSQSNSNSLIGELIYLLLKKGGNTIEESTLNLIYNWLIEQFYPSEIVPENIAWSIKALKRLFKYNFIPLREDDINTALEFVMSEMMKYNIVAYNLISLFNQINLNDQHRNIVYKGLKSEHSEIVHISLKVVYNNLDQFDILKIVKRLYTVIIQGTYKNKKAAILIFTEIPKEESMWNDTLINILLEMMDDYSFLMNAITIIHQFLPCESCKNDIIEQLSNRLLDIDESSIPNELSQKFLQILEII